MQQIFPQNAKIGLTNINSRSNLHEKVLWVAMYFTVLKNSFGTT